MSMLLEQHKKIKYLETAQYVRALDGADRAGADGSAAGGEGTGQCSAPGGDGTLPQNTEA